jgi:UDP-N-acetylmuramate--alanine ligase
MFKEKIKHFHLIGIGGIGMSGIARILLQMGYKVSGSDIAESPTIDELRKLGATIFIGHSEKNLPPETDVVVYSSAVSPDNPEIKEAKRRGIPVIPRGEMLAELMRVKEGIAVSGSHGKTTTTSMLAHIFYKAEKDPTVIIGGKLHLFEGSNARLGKSELLIAEADESDGSFLKLSPVVAVVTNIDREHLDFYGSYEKIKNAFLEFIEKVPFYGFSVLNLDDEGVREIIPKTNRRIITYGITSPADYVAKNIEKTTSGYRFEVYKDFQRLGEIELNLPGRHNISNALAAVALSVEAGIDFETISLALREFKNAQRRMSKLGEIEINGSKVIFFEDYAHHPKEIEAVLSALREFYLQYEIIPVFQPHRYTRTYFLWEDFKKVLSPFRGIITEIYPASEQPIPNITGYRLAKECGHLYAENEIELEKLLKKVITKDKKPLVVVFLGAGSIGRWGREIFKRLKEEKSN